jgi:hypothetical protein
VRESENLEAIQSHTLERELERELERSEEKE